MTDKVRLFLVLAILSVAPQLQAQTAGSTAEQASSEIPNAVLLTQAELENLVAPVALYPDTLLIQILVASTQPMEIIKSDRFLAGNESMDPDALTAAIEAEEYDPSVEVLATAFPDVTADMATHIEWTETMGDAMLAQSDDVMAAVQTMRSQAINSGALTSGEEQIVQVAEDESVIIEPSDPNVVYVPQYDPQVVYVENDSNSVGDAIVTGAIVFGTFALIDAIFDDDDDWHNYWGCRNCAGWGGGPIYRNPDIDINVDGNVNIGNRFDRDRVNLREREDRGEDGRWKPADRERSEARKKIANKRSSEGKTNLRVNKNPSQSDKLRSQLSARSGATDISRPGLEGRPSINRPSAKPDAVKKAAAARTARPDRSAPSRPKTKERAAVRKPVAPRKPTTKRTTAVRKPVATKKRAPAAKSRAGSARGAGAGRKTRGRR